jgi:hypothetical protein
LNKRLTVLSTFLIILLSLSFCPPSESAVADFCWCGFIVAPSVHENSLAAETLSYIFEKHRARFERKEVGIIHQMLKKIQWDEMTYHGYVGQTGPSFKSTVLENLSNTYGFFLSIDQILPFEPDEVTLFEKTYQTYATYIFGSLNLFNMETRNLIYSRPFFVIHQGKKRLGSERMVDLAVSKIASKIADPDDPFSRKMLKDLQGYFGEVGEQHDAVRMITGALTDTYGVLPVCDKCLKTNLKDLSPESMNRLRLFARYFFNVKMAESKQVTPILENQSVIQEKSVAFKIKTSKGDVRFVQHQLARFDKSGQALFQVNIPEPANPVLLSLRYVIQDTTQNENALTRQYNAILDFCVQDSNSDQKRIYTLPNRYEKILTGSRITSDVYYFNSLINAIAGMKPDTF